MLFELAHSLGHVPAVDDLVATKDTVSLPSADSHDYLFRDAGTARVPGAGTSQIIEE
jgi:hypothetical protein